MQVSVNISIEFLFNLVLLEAFAIAGLIIYEVIKRNYVYDIAAAVENQIKYTLKGEAKGLNTKIEQQTVGIFERILAEATTGKGGVLGAVSRVVSALRGIKEEKEPSPKEQSEENPFSGLVR